MDKLLKKIETVKDKKKLAKSLEKITGNNVLSIYNHWLTGFKIPLKHQETVLKETQKQLKAENVELTKVIKL